MLPLPQDTDAMSSHPYPRQLCRDAVPTLPCAAMPRGAPPPSSLYQIIRTFYHPGPLPSCRSTRSYLPNGMESTATRYYLEINDVPEGPMSAKALTWKAGMASREDVLRYRKEGSDEWLPLDGDLDSIKQQAAQDSAAEAPVASPPKLKLKRKNEAPPPFPTDSPPPFPTDYPPPPPGDDSGAPFVPDFGYDDNNLPPPPGAPMAPMPQLGMGTHGMPSQQPSAPATPPHPPAKLSSLMVASLVISLAIAIYIFFLMKQDVSGSATRRSDVTGTPELRGLKYTVLTHSEAESWKSAALEKLAAFAAKAKTESDASAGRVSPLVGKADDLATKYAACSQALFLAGTNAKVLGISYTPGAPADIKSLRTLEAAMEIAEPYLSPAARTDMEGTRFGSVALAVTVEGFPKLVTEYEAEIRELESKLSAELDIIRPIDDAAGSFLSKMMYAVPEEVSATESGTADSRGQFTPELTPGDYYIIATAERGTEVKPSEWAVGFTVKALADNVVQLNETNLGNNSPDSLWKPADTSSAEQNIIAIRAQATSIRAVLEKIQTVRRNIEQRKKDLERFSER